MSRYFSATVLENRRFGHLFRLLTLTPHRPVNASEPGQFYMLQPGSSFDPLLKRPLSVYRCKDGALQFLFRVRGKGTMELASRRQGDIINALGPLGNAYPVPTGDFIAVAGGIGIASLQSLLERFAGRAYLFLGARTKSELIGFEEAVPFAKQVSVVTDDGSEGERGIVTDVISCFLSAQPNAAALAVYACGPTPMLKALGGTFEKHGMTCHASLEERMACGIGACLGCVVKTIRGQDRVCKEGPVFDLRDILW